MPATEPPSLRVLVHDDPRAGSSWCDEVSPGTLAALIDKMAEGQHLFFKALEIEFHVVRLDAARVRFGSVGGCTIDCPDSGRRSPGRAVADHLLGAHLSRQSIERTLHRAYTTGSTITVGSCAGDSRGPSFSTILTYTVPATARYRIGVSVASARDTTELRVTRGLRPIAAGTPTADGRPGQTATVEEIELPQGTEVHVQCTDRDVEIVHFGCLPVDGDPAWGVHQLDIAPVSLPQYDYVPVGQLQEAHPVGRMLCGTCNGSGRRVLFRLPHDCEDCDGTGWRGRDVEQGSGESDNHTGGAPREAPRPGSEGGET